MQKDQIHELKVEIDKIKYNDLNNSMLNMSTLSVNQQMVSDMEAKIQRLERENAILSDTKNDGLNI